MLGQCRQCGGKVSDKAAKCPHCGQDAPYVLATALGVEPLAAVVAQEQPAERSTDGNSDLLWFVGGLMVVVVVVIAALNYGGEYTATAPAPLSEPPLRQTRPPAQPPPSPCAEPERRWSAGLRTSSNGAALERFIRETPARCAIREAAQQRLAALAEPQVQATPPQPLPPQTQAARDPAAGLAARQPLRDCADCPEMVVIPAGSFNMGSPASEANRGSHEGPQRRITFARDFAVGRFEVTRGQYAAFVRASARADGGSCHTINASGSWEQAASATWRNPGFTQGEDHPVVCVSWQDARAYVAWLNTQTRGGYRLLSEAEWEYAARAGTTTPFVWGSDANAGCAFANGADATARARHSSWTGASTCNDGALHTAAAGSYRANAFGLTDMIGNAREWTQDCYADSLDFVPSNGSANETGACSYRGYRGGSWDYSPRSLRSADRTGYPPTVRSAGLGFRVARTLN